MKQRISIRDLAARYCNQGARDGQSYLCHFITKSLGLGDKHDVQDALRIQWCAKFGIDQEWAGRRGTILETWNVDCVEFEDISTLLTSRQYRMACLKQAARLHPDWVLEF